MSDEVVARAVAEPSADYWRPTRALATSLTGLLGLQALAQLLLPVYADNAARYVKWHAALDALLDGRNDTANRIYRDANQGASSWGALNTLATVAALALVIIWMWRSAHNARALGRTRARLAPGWAIASWFIPLASYVLPYLIFSDLWRSSGADTAPGDGWRRVPGSTLVRLWWAAHVGGSVLSFGAIGLAVSGTTDESVTRALLIASAVVYAAGSLFSILVIRDITARQEAQQAADPAPTSRPAPRQYLAPTTVDGPGWYADPSRHYDHRYWDGSAWTEHVSTAGVSTTAPVTPPDWYPDPTGRFHWRYWTGHEWTEHVSRDQELFLDPIDDAVS